jgi:hypothetical protein
MDCRAFSPICRRSRQRTWDLWRLSEPLRKCRDFDLKPPPLRFLRSGGAHRPSLATFIRSFLSGSLCRESGSGKHVLAFRSAFSFEHALAVLAVYRIDMRCIPMRCIVMRYRFDWQGNWSASDPSRGAVVYRTLWYQFTASGNEFVDVALRGALDQLNGRARSGH